MTLRVPGVDPPLLPGILRDEADRAELMKNDVFISYAAPDISAAEAIVAALEATRLCCFFAPRDIPAGMERAAAIIDAIFETKLFLLLFSDHANHAIQMSRELQLVHDRHITVLPVRLDASTPNAEIEFFLKRQVVFNASEPPIEQHLGALVEMVRARLGTEPLRRPA